MEGSACCSVAPVHSRAALLLAPPFAPPDKCCFAILFLILEATAGKNIVREVVSVRRPCARLEVSQRRRLLLRLSKLAFAMKGGAVATTWPQLKVFALIYLAYAVCYTAR